VNKKGRYILQSGVEKTIKEIRGKKFAEHAAVPEDLLKVSEKVVSE
jgi:hypothetical protein